MRLGRCSCAQRRFGCPLHMAQGGRRKASPSLWRTSARPNPSTGSARAGSPTVTTARHGRGVSMVAVALTAGRPAEPNCSSSHGGPFRSGSARLRKMVCRPCRGGTFVGSRPSTRAPGTDYRVGRTRAAVPAQNETHPACPCPPFPPRKERPQPAAAGQGCAGLRIVHVG